MPSPYKSCSPILLDGQGSKNAANSMQFTVSSSQAKHYFMPNLENLSSIRKAFSWKVLIKIVLCISAFHNIWVFEVCRPILNIQLQRVQQVLWSTMILTFSFVSNTSFKMAYTLFLIGNLIFHLSLELLKKFWKMSLKVA